MTGEVTARQGLRYCYAVHPHKNERVLVALVSSECTEHGGFKTVGIPLNAAPKA